MLCAALHHTTSAISINFSLSLQPDINLTLFASENIFWSGIKHVDVSNDGKACFTVVPCKICADYVFFLI